MSFLKALLFVGMIAVVLGVGEKVLDHYDEDNINNFSEEQKPDKTLKKAKVPSINIKIISEQKIKNSYFTIWIEKDTNCRFVTHSSTAGNDSGDSTLMSLGCGVKSNNKPGFSLVKQSEKFSLVKDSWTDKEYLVYKHSIIEYPNK